jgi:DNA-binding CsgD family transcriptional regulator
MLNRFADILDRFDACQNADAVWQAGTETFQRFAIDWITAGTSAVDRPGAPVLRSSVPADLMAGYIAQDMQDVDPWMRHCRNSPAMLSMRVEAALRQERVTAEARLAQLFESFAVARVSLLPVYSGRYSGGLVLYARDGRAMEAQLVGEHLVALRLAAAVFANAYRPEADVLAIGTEVPSGRYDLRKTLTMREAQTLCWLAEGMSTAQIAYRMGIQPVSVTKNLASIRRKLGTTTREQSLVVAIRLGLIAP